jgi:anti-sigma regulatory factor (Ser/Thr protein kinase)
MEWRSMNCGHPDPVMVRKGIKVNSSIFSKVGGSPIGFPFGDERPYSATDEVVFKDEGDTFLLLYTDGLIEARHAESNEECGVRAEEIYEELIRDPSVANKAVAVLDALKSEGYQLNEDDCTAISIHMLDPLKIVIEQTVPRNIYLVSDVARQSELDVIASGISNETAALVRLLVMELGANLVEHSGLGAEDSFWLQIRVDGKVCQVVLMDEGEEWDLEEALNRKLDDAYMGEHGRGLAITNSIANRIERYRINMENLTYCTVIDEEES